MNRMIQWVLAATLICGASMFTACSTNDLPVDPNPLAKQVSGLWWSLNDEEGTCGEGDASQSYTRLGQAVCFNEDGTGYGASFFFNDEESDPFDIIGGKSMAPFTYTTTADGRITMHFEDAFKAYADYFRQWTMTYADGTISASNGKLDLMLEKTSEQMAVVIYDWDKQLNGGLQPKQFNANTDFTRTKWRSEEWIYIYDGVGTDYEGKPGFSIIALPWHKGTKQTNLPDKFCDDITPENGWELVLNLCGNSTGNIKNNNYFALYNKYLGILRFFYYMPDGFKAGNDFVWQVSITDDLAQHSLYGYGVPSDITLTEKAAIGQTGNDTFMEYVTPWVDYLSQDGLITPNAGWWAFDVDLSTYRANNNIANADIKLQMRSWETNHTSLYSTMTAKIDGTIKASLKLDQVVKKSSNSTKGILMGLQAASQAGSAIANFIALNWAGGLNSMGQVFGTGQQLAGLGKTGATNYTGSLDGTISLGLNGNLNTAGTIAGSKPTTGITSPTLSLKDFDLKNSTIGQGVWNIKSVPVVYWAMDTNIAWEIWREVPPDYHGSSEDYSCFYPYFFDPSSVEIELNPNVFPDDQIEWLEVDAICGARADRPIVDEDLKALRAAYGAKGETTRLYCDRLNFSVGTVSELGQDDCLWDFLYGYNDKYGMDALHSIYTSEERSMEGLKTGYFHKWKDVIQGRGIGGYAIEPHVKGSRVVSKDHILNAYLPFLEVNVKVLVKMKGMEQPVVLSRNYLPEIKSVGYYLVAPQKTSRYADKMKGHTELYDYQMKRIADIISRYKIPDLNSYKDLNYIPLDGTSDSGNLVHDRYSYLFDSKGVLGWVAYERAKRDGVWFVEFMSRQPITPNKYYLTTTSYTIDGRPKDWKVMAKAKEGDAWTTIASVTNDTRLPKPKEVGESIEYNLDVTGRQWQYFRFEISAIQNTDKKAFMGLFEFAFDKK